jgi:hypothetical protein
MRFGPPPRMMTFLRSEAAPRRLAPANRRPRRSSTCRAWRGELGGAGVDALEDRAHAERARACGRRRRFLPRQLGEARVGEAHPSGAQAVARRRQAVARSRLPSRRCRDLARNHGSILHACKSLDRQAEAHAWATPAGGPASACQGGADGVRSSSGAEPGDLDLVEAGQAGFQRAQRLLQRFLEGAADRHRLADRLHRGGQQSARRRGTSRRRSAGSW